MNTEELLAKAKKPSEDAMRLHPFYRGKIETALKCTVHSFDDFAIWYTPGVAAPCKAIQADPELVYEYTNKWNTVAVVSDGTRTATTKVVGSLPSSSARAASSAVRSTAASSATCVALPPGAAHKSAMRWPG